MNVNCLVKDVVIFQLNLFNDTKNADVNNTCFLIGILKKFEKADLQELLCKVDHFTKY